MGKDNRRKVKNKLRLRNIASGTGIVSAADKQKLMSLDASTPASAMPSSPAADQGGESNIPRLIEELDSANDFTRENACMALAGIALLAEGDEADGDGGAAMMAEGDSSNDAEAIRMIVEQGGASKLSQKLCDPCYAVRIAAVGALRNMAIVGGQEMCQMMVQDSILLLIMSALKQTVEKLQEIKQQLESSGIGDCSEGLERKTKRLMERYKERLETAREILSLLSILCEESPEATHGVTRMEEFIPLVMHMIVIEQRDFLHKEVALSAAMCLHIVSDENLPLAELLEQSHGASSALMRMLEDETRSLQFRVTIAGIVFNMLSVLFEKSASTGTSQGRLRLVEHVYPTLVEAMRFETVNNLNKMISTLVQLASDERDEMFDPQQNAHAQLSMEWTSQVSAQTMSFEILTNIVSFLAFPDDDTADDMYEDIDEYEQDEEATMDVSAIEEGAHDNIPQEFLQFVQQGQFIVHIVSCFGKALDVHSINALILSQPHGVEKAKQAYEAAVRCLSCLCSTFLAAPSDELCKYDVDGLWSYAHTVLEKSAVQWQQLKSQQGDSNDDNAASNSVTTQMIGLLEEMIELVTRLMWIVSRKPQPSAHAHSVNIGKCTVFHTVPLNHAQLLAQLVQGTVFSEETRVNCIGTLAQIGQQPHTQQQNVALAELIASKLGDPSLMFISELLNTVFDIYKDQTFDTVLAQTGLLQKLQVFGGVLSNRLKQVRAKMESGDGLQEEEHEEAYFRAKEASLNLRRFLQFKSKTK